MRPVRIGLLGSARKCAVYSLVWFLSTWCATAVALETGAPLSEEAGEALAAMDFPRLRTLLEREERPSDWLRACDAMEKAFQAAVKRVNAGSWRVPASLVAGMRGRVRRASREGVELQMAGASATLSWGGLSAAGRQHFLRGASDRPDADVWTARIFYALLSGATRTAAAEAAAARGTGIQLPEWLENALGRGPAPTDGTSTAGRSTRKRRPGRPGKPEVLKGSDWPTYQHDNARSGVSPDRIEPPLSVRWVFEPPFPPARGWPEPLAGEIVDDWHWAKYRYGFNTKSIKLVKKVRYDDCYQVVAAGGVVYFASSADNCIYSLDAASGEIRWAFRTGAPPRLAPTVWKDKVYFGSDDGLVYCLNAGDGTVVWKLRGGPEDRRMLGQGRMMSVWPIRTGVLIEDGIAYFGAGLFPAEGLYLYAVKASDGSVVWKNEQYDKNGKGDVIPEGYLLAAKNRLVMTSGRLSPGVFDRADGAFRFALVSAGGGRQGGSYVMLDGDTLFNGTQHLGAFDLTKGSKDRWPGSKLPYTEIGSWWRGRRIVLDDAASSGRPEDPTDRGTAYLATNTELVAFPFTAMKKLAVATEEAQKVRYANRGKGGASVAAAEKKLNATLDSTCRWRLAGSVPESLILAGGVLYAGGKERVIAVDAKSGRKLWEEKVEGTARGLAAALGRLFVSTTTGRVYCFGPGAAPAGQDSWTISPREEGAPYPSDRYAGFYKRAAEDIVAKTGVRRGYCAILGGGTGRLAYELAKSTELNIYVAEPDAKKAGEARKALSRAGLYGNRVTVDPVPLGKLPYPPYFANLVICEEAFFGGRMSTPAAELWRVVRPCGGIALVGQPEGGARLGKRLAPATLRRWLGGLDESETEKQLTGSWAQLTRGKLKGAGSWSHYCGDAANTASSDDRLTRLPFGVLWFGDPGERHMISRHKAPATPLSVNGRIFVGGESIVMCYDAYNGVHLWDRKLPGIRRRSMHEQSGHMAATDDGLFVAVQEKCLHLDAATGEIRRTFLPPKRPDGQTRQWGWVATDGTRLYGSRSAAAQPTPKYWRVQGHISDLVFASEIKTGKTVWKYGGKDIVNIGIALGGGTVFLLDKNVTDAQRQQATAELNEQLNRRRAALSIDRKGNPVGRDVRLLVALDAATGERRWAQPLDVTGCVVDSKGEQVTLMYKDDILLVCSNQAGKTASPWSKGTYKNRYAIALNATTGEFAWIGVRNYRSRPLIAGDTIYAEPWAFDLKTGRQRMLSGGKQPWKLMRGYGHCSVVIGSAMTLFFRTHPIGMFDVSGKSDIWTFGAMRPGCVNNCISGGGLLMIPEGSAHCTCPYAIQASIVLYPREQK